MSRRIPLRSDGTPYPCICDDPSMFGWTCQVHFRMIEPASRRTVSDPEMPSMGVIDNLMVEHGDSVERYGLWLRLHASPLGGRFCAALVLRTCLPETAELHFEAAGAKL